MCADSYVPSHRILAYAGFDPQKAVQYWSEVPATACTVNGGSNDDQGSADALPFQFLRGGVHDERTARFEKLLQELERWRRYAESHPKTIKEPNVRAVGE